MLHFERFSDKQDDVEEIIDIIKLTINIIDNNRLNKHKNIETDCSVYSKEADEILDRYDKFCQETENEAHGKTGPFWMKYINLMHIYHKFIHNVRTGDFEVYPACLPEITNLLFAVNHVNYVRWHVKHYDALMKPPHTHAEV